MATSINVRLSDELEERLKKSVEEIKNNTPRGAEVNNSTVVRGALEEFIEKTEEEKKGIYKFPISLNLDEEESKNLQSKLKEIILSLGSKKEEDILSGHLEMIYQKVAISLISK